MAWDERRIGPGRPDEDPEELRRVLRELHAERALEHTDVAEREALGAFDGILGLHTLADRAADEIRARQTVGVPIIGLADTHGPTTRLKG